MPPTPRYRLLHPATGDRPELRFVREVHDEADLADSDWQPEVDVQAALRRWLLRVGSYRTRAACKLNLECQVSAITDHALRSLVRRQRGRAERAFAAMKSELHSRHEITAVQARALQTPVELDLVDARGRPSRRLPSKEWLLDEAH